MSITYSHILLAYPSGCMCIHIHIHIHILYIYIYMAIGDPELVMQEPTGSEGSEEVIRSVTVMIVNVDEVQLGV